MTTRPLISGFLCNAHDRYANALARPLLIALKVVRTSFGFHLRECMGRGSPLLARRLHEVYTAVLKSGERFEPPEIKDTC